MWIIDSLVTRLSPHPRTPTRPFTLEVLWIKEHILTFFFFDVFTFRLAFESYEKFGGVPCKFCKNMFKDKNTLFYHIMMDLCLEYTGKELSKMYPTITKSKIKKLTKLSDKHGKTLPNRLKCPIDDVVEHSTKRAAPIKNHKQPMGMPLTRPALPNKEVYELNNNEFFSWVRIAKISKLVIYYNILIFPMQCGGLILKSYCHFHIL